MQIAAATPAIGGSRESDYPQTARVMLLSCSSPMQGQRMSRLAILIISAALLLAVPAMAQKMPRIDQGATPEDWKAVEGVLGKPPSPTETGKAWVDETCSVMLETRSSTDAPAFTISTMDDSYRNSCRISEWPLDNPKATLICADNTTPTLEFNGNDAVFDGLNLLASGNSRISLFPAGDKRTTCD